MARPTKRTPATVAKIVEAIEGGAYDHVAAGSAGIHRDTFREWLKDPEFSGAIELARARARGIAEAEVFRLDPRFWLTKGPGKTKPDAEGWTEATKLELTGKDGSPLSVGFQLPAGAGDAATRFVRELGQATDADTKA